MKFIEWTSDLDTGFHDIDKQHQELVFHINKFYQANETGDKERMSIVLFDLIASAHSHFEYEEKLMEDAHYPLMEPHRRVHQNFVNKLMDLHAKLHSGEDVSDELLTSLDGWLFRHIKINDKGYINSVNEAGVYHDSPDYAAQLAAQSQEYGEVGLEEAVAPEPQPEPEPVAPTLVFSLQDDAPKQPAPQLVEVKEAPKAPEPPPAPKPEVKKEERPIRSWAGNYTD